MPIAFQKTTLLYLLYSFFRKTLCVKSARSNPHSFFTLSGWILLRVGFICLFILNIGSAPGFSFGPFDNNPAEFYNEPAFEHPYLEKPKHLETTNYEEALKSYKEVANLFKEEKNWLGYAWTLNQVAKVLLIQLKYDLVLPYLEEALAIEQKELGEYRRVTSNTYYFLGEYYFWIGKPTQSLSHFHSALDIRSKLYDSESLLVTHVFLLIGKVYTHLLFDYNKAEEYYNKVLDGGGAAKLSPAELYSLYYNLAATSRLNKNYEKALLYGSQALDIASSLQGYSPYYLGSSYSLLAKIYKSRPDYQEAIKHHHMAIKIWQANNLKEDLASEYVELSGNFIAQKKYGDAFPYLFQAQSLLTNQDYVRAYDNNFFLSNVYSNLGKAYQGLQNFDSASYYFKKNIELNLNGFGKKHPETALAYHFLAELYRQQKLYPESLKFYQEAIISYIPAFESENPFENPSLASIGQKFHVFESIAGKANALKAYFLQNFDSINGLKQALASYLLADELISSYIRSNSFEDAQLHFIKNTIAIYEEALDCAYWLYELTKDTEYVEYAFLFMEKSKSRVLLEALKEAEAIASIGIPDSVKYEDNSLMYELAHNEKLLTEELQKEFADDEKIKKLRLHIMYLDNKLERFRKQVSKQYPVYYKVKHNKEVLGLSQLNNYLLKHRADFIEYFWGENHIFALHCSGDKAKFMRIPNDDELKNSLLLFLQHFIKNPTKRNSHRDFDNEFGEYTSNAHFIYKKLIAWAYPDINSSSSVNTTGKKLIVVPDGIIAQIPLNALLTSIPDVGRANYKTLPYFINQFSLSTAFSATSLVGRDILKIASPPNVLALSYSNKNQLAYKDIMLTSGEISGTSGEIDAIAAVFSGKFLKGEEASENQFKYYAPYFDIIHLAVHGITDDKYKYSKLVFKSAKDTVDDGYLHPYELYNLSLKARLVVLSACESGIGKFYQGEGLYSMARGFAYAGSPSIVSTLWKIDDNITATIMGSFYENLSIGLPIDESLRAAQLRYLNSGDELTSHPKYWAAFVPMGNMNVLAQKSSFTTTIALVVIAMTIVVVLTTLYLYNKKSSFTKDSTSASS